MHVSNTIAALGLNPAQIRLLSGFIDTYLQLNSEEETRFQIELERVAPPQQQEEVMQIVTSWMREGIEIGRQEGIQEGIREGIQEGQKQAAIAFVLRLLERKCGPIAEETRDRIEILPFEQLEALGEALLEFQEPDDLERWLEALESEETEKESESD